jgi:uncharacterized membrane protein (UPF0127 family)
MTMNRAAIIVGVIIVIIIGIWVFLNLMPLIGGIFGGAKGEVRVKDQTFKVIVADTLEEREKGLSNKNSLPEDQGMLFIFDSPEYYSFWMKEMKFPIDIIFIANNKVVSVYENVAPPDSENTPLPLYKPTVPADKVLEINGGLADEFGIQPGDTVEFTL